ncbi:MAG: transcription antitermination factor NusB [Clostridia bacterium]|nr:transcription antitermination factor NusB [Clostridia bacterium]
MTTSKAREQAFILIFEKSFNQEVELSEIYDMAVETECIFDSKFTKKLAFFTHENCEKIDAFIEKYSVSWKINRISKVALAVMRIAIGEILSDIDTPVGVVINEAVELCKVYAEKDDYSFVNGILSSFVKEEIKK